jgi:hypothetical protein
VLQGCYKGVTKVLQRSYKGVARVLHGYYKCATKVLQKYYKDVTKVLPSADKRVTSCSCNTLSARYTELNGTRTSCIRYCKNLSVTMVTVVLQECNSSVTRVSLRIAFPHFVLLSVLCVYSLLRCLCGEIFVNKGYIKGTRT